MLTYKVYLEQAKSILIDIIGQIKFNFKGYSVDFWPNFLEAVTMVTEV